MKLTDIRTIGAQFQNTNGTMSGVYSYFVPKGIDTINVGDLILTSFETNEALDLDSEDGVPVSSRNERYGNQTSNRVNMRRAVCGARIAVVKTIDRVPNPKATRFFLAVLSTETLVAQARVNKDMLVRVAESKHIMARLDELLLEQSKLDHYKRLALENPEAKKLLDQLTGEAD